MGLSPYRSQIQEHIFIQSKRVSQERFVLLEETVPVKGE